MPLPTIDEAIALRTFEPEAARVRIHAITSDIVKVAADLTHLAELTEMTAGQQSSLGGVLNVTDGLHAQDRGLMMR